MGHTLRIPYCSIDVVNFNYILYRNISLHTRDRYRYVCTCAVHTYTYMLFAMAECVYIQTVVLALRVHILYPSMIMYDSDTKIIYTSMNIVYQDKRTFVSDDQSRSYQKMKTLKSALHPRRVDVSTSGHLFSFLFVLIKKIFISRSSSSSRTEISRARQFFYILVERTVSSPNRTSTQIS
jgi:hypothetical protein